MLRAERIPRPASHVGLNVMIAIVMCLVGYFCFKIFRLPTVHERLLKAVDFGVLCLALAYSRRVKDLRRLKPATVTSDASEHSKEPTP